MDVDEAHPSRKYLVLKEEHANFLDLLRFLFSPDSGNSEKFVKSSESDVRNFRRRWIIFISIFAQKMLLYFKRPLAFVGYAVEMWLNLLSTNGGFGKLLLHLLKGTVVVPNKESANFRSFLGHADTRIDLDRNIIHNGDNLKYVAALSIMAAKISYENEACIRTVIEEHWKMELVGYFNFWNDHQKDFSTQAIIVKDTTTTPNLIVVAFRGTSPFDASDWLTDIDLSWHEIPGIGKVHNGFMKALGLQTNAKSPKKLANNSDQSQLAYYTIRDKLKILLQENEGSQFIVTGHSLGGSLAILLAGGLIMHEETWLLKRLNGVYTFGQPRVGNGEFGNFMEEKMRIYNVRYMRYVYCNDIVPRLPYDDQTCLYKHFGVCLYFNSFYNGKVTEEEPNKNNFSLLWMIPKRLNVIWELIRGFTIPYIKGEDYKESWFMIFTRLSGLVTPGIVSHYPQDYNNITRLGSVHIHLQETYLRASKHD